MTEKKALTIGQLAKLSNISIATIRHYESLGLIKPCSRSASNYRLYTHEQTTTLNFILNAKSVGLNLKSIKDLIKYSEQKRSGAAFKTKMQDHLTEIDQKISDLKKIKKTVENLLNACDGNMAFADCPIVKKLYGIT
ncbi:MAG: MerR family DNA-binding transcriptional regulator [Coxiellaceae bacterium]|nr:MerR family DNA-binding transcriptional regulator [Coxiellaceae bacterium]